MRKGLYALALWLLVGCSGTPAQQTVRMYEVSRWENLPETRQNVTVVAESQGLNRAVPVAQTIVKKEWLPIEKLILKPANEKVSAAMAYRCGPGEKPWPYGCIMLKESITMRLSDKALLGMLAHEIGHLKMGHIRAKDNLHQQVNEFEADLTGAAMLLRGAVNV